MNRNNEAEARAELFVAMQAALPHLEQLLTKVQGHWYAQDYFYRFYHQSFKVYHCNETTAEIVQELQALAPTRSLNPWFLAIVEDAVGRSFTHETNDHWVEETRPVIEAFLHAKMFLELVVAAGRDGEQPKFSLPSGWAAVLYLYNLR